MKKLKKEVYGGSYDEVNKAYQHPHANYKDYEREKAQPEYTEAKKALKNEYTEAQEKASKEALDKEYTKAQEKASKKALKVLSKEYNEAQKALKKEYDEKLKELNEKFPHLYEAHHLYAYDAYKEVLTDVKYEEGPCIRMDVEDHQRTASWGESGEEYRKAQRALLEQGKFGEAWMMEVEYIRSEFGEKYNLHLVEAEAQLLKLDKEGKIELEDKFKQELRERQNILNELTQKEETKVDGQYVYLYEEIEKCKIKLGGIYERQQTEYKPEQVLVLPETEHSPLDVEKQQVEFEPEQNLTLLKIEHSPLDIDTAMSEWQNIRNEEIAKDKTTIDAVYAANADLYRKVTGESYDDSPEKLSNVLSQEIEERHGIDCKQAFEKHNPPNTNDQQQEQSQGITY